MFSKVKAGALQLTMFIVVVIALLLSAFILLLHTYNRFHVQTDFVLETIDNSDKGINYALFNNMPKHDTLSTNLIQDDDKVLKAHRDYWGLFEKVTSVSSIKNNTFKKIALVGAAQREVDRMALYVEDKNRPLVLVGNAKIQGVAHLPKQGVRTGNISGHSYYGNALIYGSTKTSSKLPKLHLETLEQIKGISNTWKNSQPDQFIDLDVSRVHQNSFYKLLQIIYSPFDINLTHVSLTGHILVQSESKITVDASSKLKDVVLIAPRIVVKSNTEAVFQALATKGITIGKGCQLNYPSAFVLQETTKNITANTSKETPMIRIDKGTVIKGVVAYFGDTVNYKSQVFFDENTTLFGEVYCNKNLELLGHVNGSVFTSGFVAKQSGSVYQNHIYNGTIIVDKLPQEYVGLPFNNSKKGIVKWLY